MTMKKTALQQAVEGGATLLLAEMDPPKGSDAESLREAARRCAGVFQAMGISDNRDGARLAALAAASIVAAEGMEPLMHVVTRDRNRIALISECLGAQAMGIRNILCTSGVHQTLGPATAARAVFDLDTVQLLGAYNSLHESGAVVGEGAFENVEPLFLAATASPAADPMELQIKRIEKKIAAGAALLITQPVFDLDRFDAWWETIRSRGIHERVAFVAGIEPLKNAKEAQWRAAKRPDPRIPKPVLERIASKSGEDAQREEGLAIALETVRRLSAKEGLRGFQLRGDVDLALTIVERAELKVN